MSIFNDDFNEKIEKAMNWKPKEPLLLNKHGFCPYSIITDEIDIVHEDISELEHMDHGKYNDTISELLDCVVDLSQKYQKFYDALKEEVTKKDEKV